MRHNGGFLRVPRKKGPIYINLTDYQPSPGEEELLQYGLNCHVIEKPSTLDKRIEIESLLESIFTLEDGGTVTTTEELQPLMLAEALCDEVSYGAVS